MNAGGGGLERFGPDRADALTGASREERAAGAVQYAWAEAVASARVGGQFGWDLPVEVEGEYSCGFHFAEFMGAAPGERVFNVEMNGAVREGVDVAREVGQGIGWAFWLSAGSEERRLRIRLGAQVGEAMLGALTCSRVGAAPGAAPDASASPIPSSPPTTSPPTTAVVTTTVVVTTATTTGPSVPLPDVDGPLALEDDEFAQNFDLEVDMKPGFAFGSSGVDTLKTVLAENGKTGDTGDWALGSIEEGVEVAGVERLAVKFKVVRQGGDVVRYGLSMLGRFRKGSAGSGAFDNVVDFVGSSDGRAAAAMRNEGATGVERVGWAGGKPPTLSAEAEEAEGRTAAGDDKDGGGTNVGAIVGGVLGGLALFALLGAVALFVVRRRGSASSRDFDAPPPPDASLVAGSEVDGEVGGAGDIEGGGYDEDRSYEDAHGRMSMGDQGSYMEDPDSRLTGATSDADLGDDHSSAGINKDVWGRGTGTDY